MHTCWGSTLKFSSQHYYSDAEFQPNKQEKSQSSRKSVFIFWILIKGVLEQAFPKLFLIIYTWVKEENFSAMHTYFLLKINDT